LKYHVFFNEEIPKTTGPELFNLKYLENALLASNTTNISHYDIMATLNRFTAEVIADALEKYVSTKNYTIFISGGGMHNELLMQNLQALIPNTLINTTHKLNIHPDAKEAVLFATLANECLSNSSNKPTSFNNKLPEINMGKISLPY
jgi:anhydro-N-acetylmuramic acid kinase